jgi:hypothetical protein
VINLEGEQIKCFLHNKIERNQQLIFLKQNIFEQAENQRVSDGLFSKDQEIQ